MSAKSNSLKDDRFSKVLRDPKFRKLPKHERKVKIDKRFQSMFTDDAFTVKYLVDKRGRRISKSTTEDFKKFYDLPSDDDNEIEKESNIEQVSKKIRKKLKDLNVDYARGEGRLFSESSSDESDSEESEQEIYHEWNELDRDAETTENITNRLAVCNMDWDRVKAIDLMKLFSSFLPPQGIIQSIAIYPSEFGLERMAEEELKGPAELVNPKEVPTSESDSDEDGEEGKQYHMERMREYQLKRLKYYYAVITFNSAEVADIIYNNCNGVEYESSGIRLDLRFIDDDTTFDHEPKDICDNSNDCQKYKPLEFTNTALQQAKVELTWDETDPRRRHFTQRIAEAAKTGDVNDSDLEDLVALSSSSEEDNTEDALKAVILRNITEKCSDEESKPMLQITWGADSKTTFKAKKESNSKKSSSRQNYKEDSDKLQSKKKRKAKQAHVEDTFQVDVNDERFSALYSSHVYNIDPTNPKFSKTKGMQAFVQEKQNRISRKRNTLSEEPASKKNKKNEDNLYSAQKLFTRQ